MADLAHALLNDSWKVDATFKVDGVLTNPSDVTATAYKPDGTTESYTYPSPNISNPSTGVFRVVDTADQVGTWYIEVVGTGAAAGRNREAIIVDPRWPADLLTATALTTIEEVELLLDRVGSQGSIADEEDDDRLIAYFINTFSAAANKYLQRQLKPLEAAAAKQYAYDGTGLLSLAPFEARTVTAVSVYTDFPVADQWALVVTEDYLLHPRQKTPEGTYLQVSLPVLTGSAAVSVTGTWGAGVVPLDVSYAVAAEAANAYLRASQRAPRGIAAEDILGPDVGPLALSRRAQAMLEPHANRPIVG